MPNAPANVRGRQKSERRTVESKVTNEKRIEQFDGHSLSVSLGRLHCTACKMTVFNKWSSIHSHVSSEDHNSKLLIWTTCTEADGELKATLLAYYEANPSLL